jgi:hypothetical protein
VWAVGGPVGARGEPGRGDGKDESWGDNVTSSRILESRPEPIAFQWNSSERPENVTAG